MLFAQAAGKAATLTETENGATTLNTTGDPRLDLFGTIGSLREADDLRITRLFSEAWKADPLFATKIVFYARDIREGLGERKTFRTIIRYMAKHHPEGLRANLDLIGVYGRYDDLYSLIGTPLEKEMWAAMKKQFEEDRKDMQNGNAISLLAKWIKTADASSRNTRRLGTLTAKKLGYSVYEFKRIVRKMRRHIGIVEALMSEEKWDQIHYSAVPSRAMMIYRKAFERHDCERFSEYIAKANTGKEKIHSATLYPYDIVEQIMQVTWDGIRVTENDAIEALWRQLPNYVGPGTNALVIADTSGSMAGRPMATSVGLAVYFAERNTGPYHNLFMSFSGTSRFQLIKGETLAQKIASIDASDWEMNTNLEAALMNVLAVAVKNHVPLEEMPKSLIVISDMEIDRCSGSNWTFYTAMSKKFSKYGYKIPNIIFWNVDSRHNVFHADHKRIGVQLVSGQSATVFKQVLRCVGMNPVEAMEKIINSERYEPITVAGREG